MKLYRNGGYGKSILCSRKAALFGPKYKTVVVISQEDSGDDEEDDTIVGEPEIKSSPKTDFTIEDFLEGESDD